MGQTSPVLLLKQRDQKVNVDSSCCRVTLPGTAKIKPNKILCTWNAKKTKPQTKQKTFLFVKS